MKSTVLFTLLSLVIFLPGCHHAPPVHPVGETPNWSPDSNHADILKNEETKGNGIEVGAPKIYDDASLRMMLDATRAKLGAMTGLNQDALISRLGSISGATVSQTQIGFQVTGAPPSVSTTNTGPTSQVTTNSNLPEGNSSIPGSTAVTTAPTQSTVTNSAATSAVPTVPSGIAFTPPASISPSSLDVLNEQMQLSYEMTNLQLLLEGALSDRFVTNQRFIKPRITMGFPISLRTPQQFKDAVAVVEIEVTTAPSRNLSNAPEPPAITALLPREKTYNVAAMTDKMTSIGGAAVIGAVGLGGSFVSGHKTLYLVQDQDTVALQRPQPKDTNATSFLWEFRPVLGQHYVRGGLKQTFVQLAFPVLDGLDCYGSLRIRTYWRRFDQKNGVVGEVIPESVLVSKRTFPIPRYDLAPQVGGIEYEDLGDGTVLVTVRSGDQDGVGYLAGIYVQLGPNRYDAAKNLILEDTDLKFVAPISALAQWTGHIVARSGAATDLLVPLAQKRLHPLHQTACVPDSPPGPTLSAAAPTCPEHFSIAKVTVQPLNENESTVWVEIATNMLHNHDQLLLVIGSKVFGLKDAPLLRGRDAHGNLVVLATVPTALLVSNPNVRIFRPFWSDVDGNGLHCYDDSYPLSVFGPGSATERLVLVAVDAKGNATYLLYGTGLESAKVLMPSGATLDALDNVPQDRIRKLQINKSDLGTIKKIVLQKNDKERPLLLDLPDPKGGAPKASVDSPVIQNTDELNVSVDQASDIIAVKLDDQKLSWKPIDDSTIRLLNLKAAGVTNEQKTREITLQYKNGAKTSVKFEVVAARIGVK